MATAKEYNMMFKLQAQLGREFNSSFNQAQRALQQTKSQILELNKQQADISSYQKQQTAIENTSRKLKDLQREHDNIQREMKESEGYSSTLENKLIEKQRAIDNTTIALQKQTEKLNQQKNALQEAGIDTSKLGDESKRLSNELENLAKQEKDAAEEAKKYGDVGADAFISVGTALATSGILAGLKAIFEAYSECVSIAGDFQETMSTVEALSGANSEDMAALSEQAKKLGATTKYTATEAAEAMTYMGMAGWNAQQMISGMDGVLSLAAASGEDLALTSDIVTDNLTAFGLKAKDTAHFADVLAAAATNSNTSVSVMGETFKQSASIAGALGYSIEDVSTAVGLMANAGVKGSIAGTALKNTFNGLLEGATISAAAIGEVNYSAIKADGTMKSFGETVKELRGYFAQMTEAERVNNAMAIAGQRGYNGLLAIVNSTDKDFQKLTRSINDCDGAASKMAKVRMDNFNGQVTLMNSAMDALKTTIGESFQDELKELAGIATEVLTSANDFLSANPELTKGIVILGGAVAATGAAFGAYTMVSSTINTLKQFKIAANLAASAQKALNLAISAAPYVIAGTALIAFISGINSLSERTEMAQEHIAEMAEGIRQLSDDARMATEEQQQLENVVAEYERISTTVTDATEKKEALAELQATLNELYIGEKEGLDLVNGTYDEQIDKLEQLNDIEKDVKISQITQSIEEARAAIAEAESRQIPITFSWNGNNESFENALSDFYKTWQDKGLVLSGGPDNERSLLIEGNIDEQIALLEEMQQIMRDSKATGYEYAESFQYLTAKLNDLYTLRNAPKELQAEIDKLNGKIDTSAIISGDLYDALIAVSGGYMDVATAAETYGVGEDRINSTIASAKTYQGVLKNAAGTVISGYQSAEAAAQQYGLTVNAVDISTKIETDIQQIQTLAEKYGEALEAATKSVEGQYKLWDDAAEIVAQDIDAINASLQSQNDYWNTYNDNIAVLSEKAKEIEGLREVISTFADGSPDSANMIAGLAKSTDEELKRMVENWQTVQEEQRLTSEALAELTTGAGNNIDKLREHLNETVEALNIENEAESAAKDSIDAYIKAIEDGTDDAVIAAERLSSLVAVALNPNVKVSSLPNGFAGRTPSLEELQKEMSFVGPKMIALSGAYASGTDGAKPGVALVGENGPELVYLAGGEQIYTAEETRLILKEMHEAERINNIARVELQNINKYANGTGAIAPGESSIQTAYSILNAAPVNTTEIQMITLLPELMKQLSEYYTEIGHKPGMSNPNSPISLSPSSSINSEATPINVALNVNVQSDIDGFADFLEERLTDYSGELIDKVMDYLEEYVRDRESRRYK